MSANLTTYYWAEQTNRQRLPDQATRGWLAEEAAARAGSANLAAGLCHAAGALLVRAGTRLQGMGTVHPLATPNGTVARS